MTVLRRWFMAIVTADDFRWFARRIWGQLLDEPEERFRAARLLVQVLGAGAVSGWLIATFLSAGAGISTLPGATTDAVNLIARAPGTDPKFALTFCKDPATTVARPRFPVPEASGQLVASRGTDTLTWQGPGTVTALYETKDASTPIDITPEAVKCLIEKVK